MTNTCKTCIIYDIYTYSLLVTKKSRATHFPHPRFIYIYNTIIKRKNCVSYVVRMRTDVFIDNAHFSLADSTRNVQTDTFQKLAIVDVRRGHYTQYYILLCT